MKTALVLSGGGSLGAYEVGAWKALRELNIGFDIVTGTSIGALNGYFVATNQFELLLELWQKVSIDQVIKGAVDLDYYEIQNSIREDGGKKFRKLANYYLKNNELDVTPFYELINQYVDPQRMANCPITLATVSVTWPFLKQVNTVINQVAPDYVHDYLIASSALFPGFPMRTINGVRHIDGGFRDNLPIDLALELGADNIVAIDLFSGRQFLSSPFIGAPIVKTIRPQWKLGAILNFKSETIARNMKLGYNDTMKAYNQLRGYKYTFKDSEHIEMHGRQFVRRVIMINPRYSKRVFDFLDRGEDWIRAPGDTLLRVLELIAEALDVDPTPIYELDDFITIIDAKIVISEKIQREYTKASDFNKRFVFFPPSRQETYEIIRLALKKHISLDKMIAKNEDDLSLVALIVAAQVTHHLIKAI